MGYALFTVLIILLRYIVIISTINIIIISLRSSFHYLIESILYTLRIWNTFISGYYFQSSSIQYYQFIFLLNDINFIIIIISLIMIGLTYHRVFIYHSILIFCRCFGLGARRWSYSVMVFYITGNVV